MMSIREWNIWKWGIFNFTHQAYYMDKSDMWMMFFMYYLLGTMIAGMVEFGLLAAAIAVPFLVPLVVIWPVFFLSAPFLGEIHPLAGMQGHGGVSGYSNPVNLYERGEFYLSCSKDERSAYPHNILKVMNDKRLEASQQRELSDTLKMTEKAIKEKRRARAALEVKESVDMRDVFDHLAREREGIQSDISVYKEFAN